MTSADSPGLACPILLSSTRTKTSSVHSVASVVNLPRQLPYNTESRHRRGVAQLVEHRSPKPRAAGSNPATPANTKVPRLQLPR